MVGSESIGLATLAAGRCSTIPDYLSGSPEGHTKTTPARSRLRVAQHGPVDLGRRLARILSRGGLALWCWAQALLASYETPDPQTRQRLTQEELGARVGRAARGKAYHKWWVSRALRAARDWPQPPRTEPERLAFVRGFHGHACPVDTGEAGQRARIRRALLRLRSAAGEAWRLGYTPEIVVHFVAAVLGGTADVQHECPFHDLRERVAAAVGARSESGTRLHGKR